MKSRRNNKKGGKTRRLKGGKTFSSSVPVQLTYNNKEVICDVCSSNNYKEFTGSIDKSKVRQGFGQMFFGETADVLDNTSVIIYICNTCGMCKIIRNRDPLQIIAKPLQNNN
jgi:hypothetical protein